MRVLSRLRYPLDIMELVLPYWYRWNNMNILIIEDDEFLATQIGRIFESRIISNRIRIIASLADFSREIDLIWSYDIILTDLQLSANSSEFNWFQIIQCIREHDSYVPIIVISGRWEIDILRRAFELWASDYLIKPLRLCELELRVCNWFRLYQFAGMQVSERIYRLESLEYHIDTNDFYRDGIKLILTRMNKYILFLFFSSADKTIPNSILREKIWWDRTNIVERNLRISIMRLKKSLQPYYMESWISNIHWEWYIFHPR